MNERERDAYVRAALALQGYKFDDACIARIAAQFERIEGMAARMGDSDLPASLDSAEIFRP
jgi:hypothetical protein